MVEAAAAVPARYAWEPGCWSAGAALAGGFLCQGILPLIERLFGVATSLTLLEWCDANKPLLKRLALEAPGTYSHSLMLGSMCETAAESVGARGLLARVGAYYHDVGKINKPGYFRENQDGPSSPHDRLNPAMSLLVIKGHVKDGVELSRRYGLPRELNEFIVSHHGTTLVEYFYHAAAEQRKHDADTAPDEVEFRYPGPRPRSREAAILMLADACESSVRAMPEPIAGRIETQVHQVVSKRLTDGQLDDCELTLREVHQIEASLTKSLAGIYHARVPYPSQRKDQPTEEAKGEAAPEPPAAPAPAAAPPEVPRP
jgi:putative nucleotidyltransferase with HDIG domain